MRSGLAAAVAAVGHDSRGLAPPLVEQEVEGVLQAGGHAPVVLRGDEDEGVVRTHLGGPGARVRGDSTASGPSQAGWLGSRARRRAGGFAQRRSRTYSDTSAGKAGVSSART